MGDKRQIALFSGIFVVLIGALGTLTYCQYQAYGKCKKEGESLKKRCAQEQRKIDEIPALREVAEALSRQIDVYAEILPKAYEVREGRFIEEMSKLATKHTLRIMGQQPVDTSPPKKRTTSIKNTKPNQKKALPTPEDLGLAPSIKKYSYRFELSGTFPDFLQFINEIESWTRFVAIEEIEIYPEGSTARSSSSKTSGKKVSAKELEAAQEPLKSITLVVSTYTHTQKSIKATKNL